MHYIPAENGYICANTKVTDYTGQCHTEDTEVSWIK